MCSADIFLGLLALLFPPLPVWVKCGICSADSIINILLCMLGYVPGLIHAWYIIAKYPEPPYEYETIPHDSEHGRVTYVIVRPGGGSSRSQRVQSQQPKPQAPPRAAAAPSAAAGPNYGTTSSPAPAAASSSRQPESAAGPSDGAPPPAYTEVAGDHKVQTQN